MYLYFLTDKAEALNAFKTYKVEVEKQKEKKIKIVRSDRGGEYYDRYTEKGQMIGPFAQFLQEEGIVAQYTLLGTPQQNGVAERRNRTLMDMVRSMLSNRDGARHFSERGPIFFFFFESKGFIYIYI